MKLEIIGFLIKITPKVFLPVFKKIRFNKIITLFLDGREGELIYQRNWVKHFKENKSKYLNFWGKYFYFKEIKKICNINKKSKVLDIGCGISTILHFIDGEKYGLDPLAIEYLKMYDFPKDIVIQKGSGEKLPFPKNYFDAIFCTNVLDHAKEPRKVINEARRCLKKGGYFIVTLDIFNTNYKRDNTHPHSFTKKEASDLFKGFKTEFIRESNYYSEHSNNYAKGEKMKKNNIKGLIMVLRK